MACTETIEVEYENDDGEEIVAQLPAKYEVCYRCDGGGTHVNPNIDGHGISAEEWHNDWDEEERELYMAGAYDVSCEECNGKRVLLVVDEDAIEHASQEVKDAFESYQHQARCDAEYEAECAMERRYGA